MAMYWHSLRDTLSKMLARPLWMMLFFVMILQGLIYANSTVWKLPVGIIDQDHSTVSRELIRQLNSSPKMAVQSYDSLEQLQSDLHARKLFAVLILPHDLQKKVLRGQSIVIPSYGDATNRLANGQIQQSVQEVYQALTQQYNQRTLQNSGFSPVQAQMLLQPIKGILSELFNPGISFAAITFPGLLVMLYQHSLLISSARLSIVMHKQAGGHAPWPIHLGALSALIPLWLFLSVVMFVLWPWLLGYRQTASVTELLLLTFPFLLAVLGLTKLVTECLRRVELIYFTFTFFTTPVYYLAGTIWPLQAMPGWVRFIAQMLPSTWAARILAGVNQMGLSLRDVGFEVFMLLFLGALYTSLGILIALLRDGQTLRRYTRRWRRQNQFPSRGGVARKRRGG
ncbi:MAG: ABC transporter permease [Enterobacteriaceae bacterium]